MQSCMSNMLGNPTELCAGLVQLKEEHPPLLQMLDRLLQLCNEIENNEGKEELFSELKMQVIAFFNELEPHSEREEGILFTMMAAYIGKEMGPIAVMEYEHDQAKALIGEFLEQTQAEKIYTNEEMDYLSLLIKKAYYILTDHFGKEESVLFPMAENLLSDSEKEELLKRINE